MLLYFSSYLCELLNIYIYIYRVRNVIVFLELFVRAFKYIYIYRVRNVIVFLDDLKARINNSSEVSLVHGHINL